MEVIIMRIQHNIMALNSNRQLGINNSAVARSLENYHLATGLTEQEMMLQAWQFLRR